MSRFYNALVPAAAGGLPVLPGSVSAADLPMLRLWQAVEARLAGRPRRVVQILPCTEAEADPAVAVRLARLAGKGMAGGVLLLNAVTSETMLDDDGLVAFGPLPKGGDARALNPGLLNAYWDRLSQAAGLIVIDSPALLSSPLAQAMAPTVDGVVLVVEAERTRAAIAQAARDSLKAAGANILGVVLNKRRFHVPRAIYDRL